MIVLEFSIIISVLHKIVRQYEKIIFFYSSKVVHRTNCMGIVNFLFQGEYFIYVCFLNCSWC